MESSEFLSVLFAKNIKKIPAININLFNISCPFRKCFGIPCPTCGLTRSIISLCKFDLEKSFFYHPMTIFIIIAVALMILTDVYKISDKYKNIDNIYFCFTALLTFFVYIIRLKLDLIP